MNERVSPESLLPLSFAPPAPQAELPTLVPAPHTESKELPALMFVSQPEKSSELPSLAFTSLAPPAELKPLLVLGSEASEVAPTGPEPVVAPKVVKPTVLKPAIKISQVATTKSRAKLAVKTATPKIKPAAKEFYDSLQIQERGRKVRNSAIGAVALAKSGIIRTPVALVNLKDRFQKSSIETSVPGNSWSFDISELNTTPEPSKVTAVTRIRETVSNAPFLARAVVKNRITQLNESLYERKSVLATAIGFIAVAGIGYAAMKNIDLSSGTQLIEAGDAANLGDSSGTTIDTKEQIAGPGKPVEAVVALDQTPSNTASSAPSFEDVFVVDGGEGIVENIIDDLAENGVEVSASEAYEIYKEQDVKLDGNLITGDTYRMSNGDLGISNTGPFGWQQEMQNALEEVAKEKKKKKS